MNNFGRADGLLKLTWNRIYSDFLMPSRLGLFNRLLQTALDHGYETHSVCSFWHLLKNRSQVPGKKYLILRHDVDTDAVTARRMWKLEQNHGMVSSFYFRLSTLSPALMKDMHAAGAEASYHYEEVATVSKQKGLTTADEVHRELPHIREMFRRNLFRLREQTGLPMLTVASHGDFANRKLGITNTIILADKAFRIEVNIAAEAYDRILMDHVTSLHSDKPYPVFWTPDDPLNAFRKGKEVVHILTHPRHWRVAPAVNMLDDLGRLSHGVRYR
jgi:hypothetical protein